MPKALLDSTTYIDLEKASRHRRELWASNTITRVLAYRTEHGKPYLSVVTVVEILKGLRRDVDVAKAELFKRNVPANFEFLEVSTEVGYLASELMARLEDARQMIGLADSLIAATAIQNELALVTSNSRHFQRVVDLGYPLRLENWRNP